MKLYDQNNAIATALELTKIVIANPANKITANGVTQYIKEISDYLLSIEASDDLD